MVSLSACLLSLLLIYMVNRMAAWALGYAYGLSLSACAQLRLMSDVLSGPLSLPPVTESARARGRMLYTSQLTTQQCRSLFTTACPAFCLVPSQPGAIGVGYSLFSLWPSIPVWTPQLCLKCCDGHRATRYTFQTSPSSELQPTFSAQPFLPLLRSTSPIV